MKSTLKWSLLVIAVLWASVTSALDPTENENQLGEPSDDNIATDENAVLNEDVSDEENLVEGHEAPESNSEAEKNNFEQAPKAVEGTGEKEETASTYTNDVDDQIGLKTEDSEQKIVDIHENSHDTDDVGDRVDDNDDEGYAEADDAAMDMMGIVAPPLEAQQEDEEEEASQSPNHKDYLVSYKTFLSWFLEKIQPESDADFEATAASASTGSDGSPDEAAASSTTSSTAKENETAGGTSSSSSSTSPEAASVSPGEGMSENNETQKCTGLGCFLKGSQKTKSIKCAPRNMTTLEKKREGATLDDLTRTHIFLSQGRINDALKNRKPEQGDCILILVFSPHCRFSVQMAPHVNALARAFPLLEVGAIDATQHRGVAHKFGVAGVPSLVLFQNNKMVAKLNDTEGIDTTDFKKIVKSVSSMTGLSANESVVIEDFDYEGPLKSELVEQRDVFLVLSWLFLAFFAAQKLLRSDYGRSLRQSLLLHLTIWREVAENGRNEAHPHAD